MILIFHQRLFFSFAGNSKGRNSMYPYFEEIFLSTYKRYIASIYVQPIDYNPESDQDNTVKPYIFFEECFERLNKHVSSNVLNPKLLKDAISNIEQLINNLDNWTISTVDSNTLFSFISQLIHVLLYTAKDSITILLILPSSEYAFYLENYLMDIHYINCCKLIGKEERVIMEKCFAMNETTEVSNTLLLLTTRTIAHELPKLKNLAYVIDSCRHFMPIPTSANEAFEVSSEFYNEFSSY